MSIVQGAIEAALALPLGQKLAAIFIGLPVLAIVINVLSQLVSAVMGPLEWLQECHQSHSGSVTLRV